MAQRNGLRSFLQAGESVTLAGKVGSHRTLRKRTGEPFVKASLQTEDGISVTCVWWEAVRAPRTGSKVRVLGDVREYHGQIEVHVRQTQAMSSSTPTTHSQRLISYYIDCIEAEGIQELVLREDQAGEAFLLFTQGSEPLLTRDEIVSQPLPTEISVRSWCTRRVMTGQGERVFVGYPLIAGFIERNDREIRSVAPLFFNECQLERVREGFRLVTSTQSVDMNPFALDLLGVSREERNGYLEGLESLEELGEAETELERIRIRVDFLASLGLVDSSIVLDPGNLSSFPEERPTLCNAALLFHGERAITTRKLLEDLEELLTLSPEALEEGPLGILLGGRQVESLPAGVPQPAILPTNLSQDRAITAAMETNFAVVTGPPGTGKSQVLVNTVAAAMESGESLLFASKNNQAVNVVFERLESVSAEAVPLRAGATRFRAELARRMAQALGRKTGIDVPLSSSRKAWAEVSTELRPIYDEESRRESLKRSLVAEEQAFEKRVADLPTALIALDLPASLSRKVAEVSKTAARAVGLPGFWPWSRRRFRKSREVFFSAWGRLRDSVPSPARATLPFEVVPDDVPKRLGPIRNALEAAKHSGRANGLRNELAQLTNPWDLHEQLVQVEERRLNVCRGLFEGLWKARIRQASARVREAAGIYQNAIDGLVRGRGSAAGALKQVPKVLEMFPVWGVTNLSARVNFPLSKAIFDLVVIDEASQCDIPSAIPLLFRARKALIIGDPNQLIHVTPLRPTRDSELAQRHGLEEEVFLRFGYRARSLFNLASDRIGQDPVFLDHHFRSHPSIITFSNDEIYGSRLTILSDARSETPGPPVCWINVRGEFRRGRRGSALNPPEVAQVASEIGQLWAQLEGLGLTLGVVTPFRAHAEAIRQQVAEQVPQVLEHLVVATADRFQGDERDVMIFSPTVSNDMPEFHKTFASDRNRVNVAVTRARKRLMVIGDRQACLDTPGLIGALARYVADLEEKKFESPLERRLWEALRSQGITAKPGVLVDGYRLDLAVELGAVRLDIECDGAAFHKDLRSDQTRDLALTKDGWTILRLSGREILHNIDGCVSEVLRILEGGQ